MGRRVVRGRSYTACGGGHVRHQLAGTSSKSAEGNTSAALRLGCSSTSSSSGRLERLRHLERSRARSNAGCLRLPDCAVRHFAFAIGHCSSSLLMPTLKHDSDPHVLDQPWRVWATITVIGLL